MPSLAYHVLPFVVRARSSSDDSFQQDITCSVAKLQFAPVSVSSLYFTKPSNVHQDLRVSSHAEHGSTAESWLHTNGCQITTPSQHWVGPNRVQPNAGMIYPNSGATSDDSSESAGRNHATVSPKVQVSNWRPAGQIYPAKTKNSVLIGLYFAGMPTTQWLLGPISKAIMK